MLDLAAVTMLKADPIPLARDASGVIRIGGTRVSLESLVSAYQAGAATEELVEAFPDLSPPDIHASIAYYLNHRREVEEYLEARRREAEAVEAQIRERFPEAYQRVTPTH